MLARLALFLAGLVVAAAGPTPRADGRCAGEKRVCTQPGGPRGYRDDVLLQTAAQATKSPRAPAAASPAAATARAATKSDPARAQASSAAEVTTSVTAGLATVEQEGARIPVGGTLRVFIIGSSNVLWQTWADQLHILIERLGYASPLVTATARHDITRPSESPECADHAELSASQTLRIAKPGWSSWGFAYDSMDGCSAAGFREIAGFQVSCTNSWQCNRGWVGSEPIVKTSEIARTASGSEVTVLHNWVNDFTARFPGTQCFAGEFPDMQDATLTIASLRSTIRAIHAVSPGTTVVVMAKYPGAAHTVVGVEYTVLNAAVREALADEPNTIFVDYRFPRGADMFLARRSGHANCRGDKVMAKAIVEALFKSKVIARGLAMEEEEETCLGNSDCAALSPACCQRSALCWPSMEGACLPYRTGE